MEPADRYTGGKDDMRFYEPDNSILDKSAGPHKFMLSDSKDKALG